MSMKNGLKRLFALILALTMLTGMILSVQATEVTEPQATEAPADPTEETTSATEPAKESTAPTDPIVETTAPTEPEADTSTEDPAEPAPIAEEEANSKSSRAVTKTKAYLLDCAQMDFIMNTGTRQGFHYFDTDGKKPWEYENMIYCLENDKSFSTGSGHTGVDGLTQDGNTSSTRAEKVWYGLSSDQRMAVGLILLYGAPNQWWDEEWGFNAEGNRVANNPNIGYRFATQALIWEITGGMRKATYPYERTNDYWYKRSTGVCMGSDGTDHFLEAYNGIIQSMQLHNIIPSFASDTVDTAPAIEISGDQIVVKDTNEVLSRFAFTDTGTVAYTKDGNDLTITATGAVPTDVQTAIAELPDPTATIYQAWYNSFDSSKQVCIRVSVPATDPVPAYFKLKTSTGSLDLVKTTEDGKNLSGWQFILYSDAACTKLISGPHTTNSKGKLNVEGLAAGTIWVKEIGHTDSSVSTQYVCDSANPQKVTIKAGETASVSFHNKLNLGTAKIVKATTNGGTKAGWHFTIQNSTGTVIGNYVTDSTGIIAVDVLPGTYVITETDGASEYWVNDPTSSRTVTVKANEVATVTFTNQWRGKVQIIKKATNGGTVKGWQFTVKDSTGKLIGKYTTDKTGIITLDLEPGKYKITESGGDAYWRNDPTPTKTVTVKAGQTATVEYLNEWIGKVKIVKTLDNPEAGTVEGWTFVVDRITSSGSEYVATVTTDKDGTILQELEPGKYRITEQLEENSLWQCTTDLSQTVTIKAGATAEVKFANALRPGSISIKKVDTEGHSLAGAKFILQWSEDGTTWSPVFFNDSTTVVKGGCSNSKAVDGTLVTPENGEICWDGLYPTLHYRILELETPSGYILLEDAAFEGTLPGDSLSVALRVVNCHSFTLPQTGSDDMIMLPVCLFLCMATCASAVHFLKKEQ